MLCPCRRTLYLRAQSYEKLTSSMLSAAGFLSVVPPQGGAPGNSLRCFPATPDHRDDGWVDDRAVGGREGWVVFEGLEQGVAAAACPRSSSRADRKARHQGIERRTRDGLAHPKAQQLLVREMQDHIQAGEKVGVIIVDRNRRPSHAPVLRAKAVTRGAHVCHPDTESAGQG